MGFWTVLREEFRRKKFGFGDVQPERFHIWVWRAPPVLYLLYRLILAVYVDFWLIDLTAIQATGTPLMDGISWAAFLTNWTYFVLGLYLTCHFLATFYHYVIKTRRLTRFFQRPSYIQHQGYFLSESEGIRAEVHGGYEQIGESDCDTEFRRGSIPWYLVAVWILFNVVSTSSVMVTLVFFIFLFPQLKMDAGTIDNVQLHMLNSVIVTVEHLSTGVPHRLLHIIYPLTYGLAYILFSLFYWIPDHNHVMYPGVLDWNDAGKTIGMVCIIGIVVMPAIHLIFFGIYRLKIWMQNSCC